MARFSGTSCGVQLLKCFVVVVFIALRLLDVHMLQWHLPVVQALQRIGVLICGYYQLLVVTAISLAIKILIAVCNTL